MCENEICSVVSDSETPWTYPGQKTGVGSLSFLQEIFPNPGLLRFRWILYQLSHQGSPRIMEWVAFLFSRGSSRPRYGTRVSCIAGRFFTNWAIRVAPLYASVYLYLYNLKVINFNIFWYIHTSNIQSEF